MFRGVNAINLDAKGRIAVPTKYRDRLTQYSDGQMVVTVDRERCLLLYPLPDWEEIERKLVRLPSLNKQARSLQRLLMGYATECELDSQGRILLPLPLRSFAELDKHIVMIGQGKKFEIWDEAKWDEQCACWLALESSGDETLPEELESLSY